MRLLKSRNSPCFFASIEMNLQMMCVRSAPQFHARQQRGCGFGIAMQTSLRHFEISNASSNYTSQCASRKPALVSKSTVRVARLSPGAGEYVICIDAKRTHSACVSGRRVHQVHRKSYYMSHLPSRCNQFIKVWASGIQEMPPTRH
jgi:hypothetical protein